MRGVVGRAASASVFDLERWEPSEDAAVLVEHFWSVSWDLRGRAPFSSTVITFPSMHLALIDRVREDQRVDQVIAVSPWSTRTTQRVFRRYVGVTVKWVL